MMKFLYTFLLLIPFASSAHVKWFTEDGVSVIPYSLFDAPVLIWIFAGIIIIGLFYWLEKKKLSHFSFSEKSEDTILLVANIGFGVSLLLFSYFGFVFAPNIIVKGTLGYVLLACQALIGLSYLFGIYPKIGALGLVIMYFGGIINYGWLELLDALEILGFGFYGLFTNRPNWSLISSKALEKIVHSSHHYSVLILRFFIGLNLIGLALSEKILNPGLGIEFMTTYPWNFTPLLRFPISDYWFVFSAGATEMLIGILLILGFMTRTVTLILSGFLLTTLVLLGPTELVGHLPHFSLAIVLLLLGSGNDLSKEHKA